MNFCSKLTIGLIAATTVTPIVSSAQTRESSSRTAVIVASFNKSKHAVRERGGVKVEKFKEIRTVPAVPSLPSAFSGSYEVSGMGSSLNLRIDDNGKVTGTGIEIAGDNASIMRKFSIRDAHLDGALLSGTKTYGNGSSSKLEGVFINSTSFDSPSDKGTTTFGLGVLSSPVYLNGVTVEKLFYQRTR